MSGASERERVLQLLIPSLVIVVGYVWFFVPEPQGKLDKALGQLEHARSHVTIPLQGQRQSLARVEREVAALRDERDALRRQARDAHALVRRHALEKAARRRRDAEANIQPRKLRCFCSTLLAFRLLDMVGRCFFCPTHLSE